jgi:hypothetical protein
MKIREGSNLRIFIELKPRRATVLDITTNIIDSLLYYHHPSQEDFLFGFQPTT